MDASAKVIIERPVDEVFAFATDVRYFEQWVMGVREPRWLTGSPHRGHAEFELTYAYAGVPLTFIFEIDTYEKRHKHCARTISGPVSARVDMTFDEADGCTRVERYVEFHLSPMPLPIIETLTFIARPAVAARVKADLIRLKQCIEGTAVTPGMSGAAC